MANNCQIQTPKKYVKDMLDYIGYKDQLYGVRVLENSCGEGNILLEIVYRYIEDTRTHNYSSQEIVAGLERDICAYEIDEKCIRICTSRLDKMAGSLGIEGVHWDIRNGDFLRSRLEKFDYVIGNPPYLTYHDLTEEQRIFLRNTFDSCRSGRFDYSYAFIEASLKSLNDNGKMIYLVPYSIKTNKFARKLREVLIPYLREIYDYKKIKIFPNVITSTLIILCQKADGISGLDYHMIDSGQTIWKEKKEFQDKWIFENENGQTENTVAFGDYFDVYNSVATLLNKAFVLKEYTEETGYYILGEYRVESSLVKNAASVKSFNRKKNKNLIDKIIFPYSCIDEKVGHYKESDFIKQFPFASEYLVHFKDELDARKADGNALWFEYGRNQAITKVFGEKLILPMVITNRVSVYVGGKDEIPYAGYFIKRKEQSIFTLRDAKRILESDEFYEYVKECGTPTTPTSYRISVNDIKRFRIRKERLNG